MKRWKMWIATTMVLAGVLVAGAQTNRHGDSGGIVKELPKPRISTEPGTVERFERGEAVLLPDPKYLEIQDKYEPRLQEIGAQLELKPEREVRRSLLAESYLLKMQRESEILLLLRERASLHDDGAVLDEIDSELEKLDAQIALAETRMNLDNRSERKAPVTKTNTHLQADGSDPHAPATNQGGTR